jgi:hypothetical protein
MWILLDDTGIFVHICVLHEAILNFSNNTGISIISSNIGICIGQVCFFKPVQLVQACTFLIGTGINMAGKQFDSMKNAAHFIIIALLS